MLSFRLWRHWTTESHSKMRTMLTCHSQSKHTGMLPATALTMSYFSRNFFNNVRPWRLLVTSVLFILWSFEGQPPCTLQLNLQLLLSSIIGEFVEIWSLHTLVYLCRHTTSQFVKHHCYKEKCERVFSADHYVLASFVRQGIRNGLSLLKFQSQK